MARRQGSMVMGSQTAQAGKFGLAVAEGADTSFAAMQRQVRQEVSADVSRMEEQKKQIGAEITSAEKMRDLQLQQSELGDKGLQKMADQDPFLAAIGGAVSGFGTGFSAGGGDWEEAGTAIWDKGVAAYGWGQ